MLAELMQHLSVKRSLEIAKARGLGPFRQKASMDSPPQPYENFYAGWPGAGHASDQPYPWPGESASPSAAFCCALGSPHGFVFTDIRTWKCELAASMEFKLNNLYFTIKMHSQDTIQFYVDPRTYTSGYRFQMNRKVAHYALDRLEEAIRDDNALQQMCDLTEKKEDLMCAVEEWRDMGLRTIFAARANMPGAGPVELFHDIKTYDDKFKYDERGNKLSLLEGFGDKPLSLVRIPNVSGNGTELTGLYGAFRFQREGHIANVQFFDVNGAECQKFELLSKAYHRDMYQEEALWALEIIHDDLPPAKRELFEPVLGRLQDAARELPEDPDFYERKVERLYRSYYNLVP